MIYRFEAAASDHAGWHSRGYLPHFEAGDVPQSVTFRLADSLPASAQRQIRREALSGVPQRRSANEAGALERQWIEDHLNRGTGPVWLTDPRIADAVQRSLLYFDGIRYRLHAWVIMPNHVHVMVTPDVGARLSTIVSSWKSYTSVHANALLGRSGPFWQPEYFDRFIRNARHFRSAVDYIENNPVVARLCAQLQDWPYSSAYCRSN